MEKTNRIDDLKFNFRILFLNKEDYVKIFDRKMLKYYLEFMTEFCYVFLKMTYISLMG